MAGQLTIDTLKASTGVLATQNGMTGIAKAWISYNGITNTLINSFNVSSMTKNSAGSYIMNFTTAMPNVNYALVGSAWYAGASGAIFSIEYQPSSTTSKSFGVANPSATASIDVNYITAAVFGN